MNPKRASKLFMIVLAVVLNLGGGPMAWAHLAGAGKCHDFGAPSVQMAPECPQHHTTAPSGDPAKPTSHTLPCCGGGACACATPSSVPPALILGKSSEVVIASVSEPRLVPPLSTVIDGDLRPPIY